MLISAAQTCTKNCMLHGRCKESVSFGMCIFFNKSCLLAFLLDPERNETFEAQVGGIGIALAQRRAN